MSATKPATAFELWLAKPTADSRDAGMVAQPLAHVPMLRLAPLLCPSQPRRFLHVPTHAVGVLPEHREYPRATLNLPLRLRSTGGIPEEFPITLVTRNISSTGVYFLCPRQLSVGTSIELPTARCLGPGKLTPVDVASLVNGVLVHASVIHAGYLSPGTVRDVERVRDAFVPSWSCLPC